MIDRLGNGDADAMAAAHAIAADRPWSAYALRSLIEASDVAAFGADAVAGFVLVRVAADEAEILTLAVVPASRRAGLGRALMAAAEAYALEKRAGEIFLEVAEDNAPALSLYAGLGYEAVGRRPDYYPRLGAEACDALVLQKKLVVPASARLNLSAG